MWILVGFEVWSMIYPLSSCASDYSISILGLKISFSSCQLISQLLVYVFHLWVEPNSYMSYYSHNAPSWNRIVALKSPLREISNDILLEGYRDLLSIPLSSDPKLFANLFFFLLIFFFFEELTEAVSLVTNGTSWAHYQWERCVGPACQWIKRKGPTCQI
jgi:hypothetical protein